MRSRAAIAALILAAGGVCADKPKEPDPKVTAIDPTAGRLGATFDAVIHGADLAGARAVVFEAAGVEAAVLGASGGEGREVKVRVTVAGNAGIGRHDFRLVTARGVTNKIALDVLETPVLQESAVAGPLAQFPLVVNGRLSRPGETDTYWIEVNAGKTLTFEAISGTAGFDPSVALYEASGSWFDPQRLGRIAFNDEPLYFPGLPTDARLVHRFPRAGKYCVKVQGFSGEGGPDRVYELRITPGGIPAPSLHPDLKAVFEERQFTRVLLPNRLAELGRRGGASAKEQAVEVFHAVPEGSGEVPVMTVPGMAEGRIARPGETHSIRLKIEKPQDIAFEVETPEATLPRFNPVVRLLEPGGREIATDVYTKLNNNGLYMMKMIRAKTTLSLGAPGGYTMQIRDITTGCAGADFLYRVMVRPQIPHVGNVEIGPDHVNLQAGSSRPLTVAIDREEGFRGYVTVNVEGLPAGVTALAAMQDPAEKPPLPNGGRLERYTAKEQNTTVMLVAGPDAPVSDLPVRIRVVARVVSQGTPAHPVAVKEIPLIVLPGKTS